MARKKKKGGAGSPYDVPTQNNLRELSETQNMNTQLLQTQVMEKNQNISSPGTQAPLDSAVVGREIGDQIAKLIGQFAAHASPMNGAASGGPAASGGSPGVMGGGAAGPPPTSISGNAAQRYISNLPRDGANPVAAQGGASGIATRVLGDFVDKVGGEIGRSGLEKSAGSTIRENANPGRFVESALGTASKMGIPGAAGLEGLAHKANQEAEAKDGTTALNQARARLADIAGGLAQRGARFSDSQLISARNVLQERAQRELNVRLQISRLEEGFGARGSGLSMGGHGR